MCVRDSHGLRELQVSWWAGEWLRKKEVREKRAPLWPSSSWLILFLFPSSLNLNLELSLSLSLELNLNLILELILIPNLNLAHTAATSRPQAHDARPFWRPIVFWLGLAWLDLASFGYPGGLGPF